MTKFITQTSGILDQLVEAGVITTNPTMIRRVVIDLQVGRAAMVYVEQFADDESLRVGIADISADLIKASA